MSLEFLRVFSVIRVQVSTQESQPGTFADRLRRICVAHSIRSEESILVFQVQGSKCRFA